MIGPGQFQISDDIILDSRRAAWFPDEGVLAISDLHLGYAWAHRLAGQLMPIRPAEDTVARLGELQSAYRPREIVVLGDIVHRASAVAALEAEVRSVWKTLSPRSKLTFLAGNHDHQLQQLLKQWLLPIELLPSYQVGPRLLVHGDARVAKPGKAMRFVMGHEHPAISIGDGVATSQKCPCFLISEEVLVLPAFSRWAAGTNIRIYPFMTEMARAASFTQAVAICGEKLLPIKL